jgi:flavin-dependent dehydrogenase
MSMWVPIPLRRRLPPVPLGDGAAVVVIGGGPTGAFFAIRLLRKARQLGRKLEVLILEQKKERRFCPAGPTGGCWEGCNYCAGGISPRLVSLLNHDGLAVPADLVVGKAESLTVHGDWKSIELPLPEGREMLFVFRGSRPGHRESRVGSFDSYLLRKAVEEGAKVVMGQAHELRCAPGARPRVSYRTRAGTKAQSEMVEADFVVVAAGVNQTPGMGLEANCLYRSLREAMPGFRPPKVRRAVIGEMRAAGHVRRLMEGQVHFAQYGAKDLDIEMSSLIPKGD